MKKKTIRIIGYGIGALLAIITVYALSWIITCGIIKLISMCFGFAFSWKISTGIWLIYLMLQSIFTVSVKK